MNKNCLHCNKSFSKNYSDSSNYWSRKKYCSISCAARQQTKEGKHPFQNRILSDLTREKMSKAKLGIEKGGKISLFCKECMGIFIAKRWRADKARFCSHECASNNRNHGLTPANEKVRKSAAYKAWRTLVFERDNYTCQECGSRGGYLHADHIKPFALFPELRFEVSNGRTLCIPCHKKTPTYGRRKIYRDVAVNSGF